MTHIISTIIATYVVKETWWEFTGIPKLARSISLECE
jgi:hypothetical protein